MGIATTDRVLRRLWVFGFLSLGIVGGITIYVGHVRTETAELNLAHAAIGEAAARLPGGLAGAILLGSEPTYDRANQNERQSPVDRGRETALTQLYDDLAILDGFLTSDAGRTAVAQVNRNLQSGLQLLQEHDRLSLDVGDYGDEGFRQDLAAANRKLDDAIDSLRDPSALPLRHLLAAKSSKDSFFAGFSRDAQATTHRALTAFAQDVRRAPVQTAERARLLDSVAEYDQAFQRLSEGLIDLGANSSRLEELYASSSTLVDALVKETTQALALLRAERMAFTSQALAAVGILLTIVVGGYVFFSLRATERLRKSEGELLASSARMSDLARVSSDLFWEIDADGFIRGIDGPETFSSFYGPRMIGQRFYDALRELGVKFADGVDIAKVWTRHRLFRDLEYKVVMPVSEQTFWYSLSGLPMFDDQGNFAGYRCASKDITNAKQLRLETEAFRNQLSSTLSHLPAAAFRLEQGKSGIHPAFVSHNAIDVVGVSADAIMARSAETSFFIHPADRERFDRDLAEGLETSGVASARGRVLHPDGTLHWIQALVRRSGSANKTRTIDGIWIDVTTDQVKTTRLRDIEAAIQAASDGVMIFAEDNIEIIYANTAVHRIMGIPEGVPVSVEQLRERLRVDESVMEGFRAEMANAVARSGQWSGQFTVYRDDGSSAVVSARITGLNDGRYLHVITDVTDQLKLENEREAARSQLSSTLVHLQAAAFRVEEGPNGIRRTFVSDNSLDVIGIPPAAFKANESGTAFYFIAEDRQRVKREIVEGLEASGGASSRGRIRRADGSERWIQAVVRKTKNRDDSSTIEGIWIDVTNEELQNSQLRDIGMAIEAAGDGIMFFGPDGTMLSANASAYRIFDIPAGSDLGAFRQRLGMDEEGAGVLRETIKESVRRAGQWTGTLTVHRNDGVAAPLFVRVTGGLDNGKLLYVLTDMSELTQAKLAFEHELEKTREQNALVARALNSVRDYICIEDKDCKLTYMNQITLDALGVPLADAVGKSFFANERVKYDDNERLEREIRAALAREGTWTGEIALTRPSGLRQLFNLRATKLADGGALYAATDITAHRAQELEEAKLKQRLADAERMEAIGRLAGGIAHDFNNIIGATRAFADLLVEDLPPGSDQRLYAERIVNASRRATELVKEVMTFSRASQAERKPTELTAVFAEGLDILGAKRPQNVALDLHNLPKPAVVDANASQLIQVLVNLVVNAVDALEGKSGTVTVRAVHMSALNMSTERTDAGYHEERGDGGVTVLRQGQGLLESGVAYVKLSVEDTGPGMARTTMQRIFEPFFTTKGRDRGTGLGVPVVSSIVAAHGGLLQIATRRGQGTSVAVYLPISETASVAVEDKFTEHNLRGSERILIVDDEIDLADAISIGLSRLGYEAAPVYTPGEAITLFTEGPDDWDVLISDQVMPQMKGLQLVKKARSLSPNLKIILCTGHSDAATDQTARQSGADLFLHKPVTAERLAQAVRTLVDG